MKSTDLRIGNLTEYNTEEGWYENIVDAEDLLVIDNNKDYRSVSLTPQWLEERTDFEKIKVLYSEAAYKLGEFTIILNKSGKLYYMDSIIRTELKTVHHLQNLYYDIEIKEFEIKQLTN